MELIVLTERRGAPHVLRLRSGAALLLAAALALLLAAALWFGLQQGRQQGRLEAAAEPAPPALALGTELAVQRRELEQAQRNAEGGLNALSRRLGRLQAELMRLEGLGERLVGLARLPEGEFDFRSPPALGGPGLPEAPASRLPDFLDALERLSLRMRDRAEQLQALEGLLGERRLQHSLQPAGRPVREGYISSGFGRRADPITGRQDYHRGLDFSARPGTDVLAVADGVVSWSGFKPAYGHTVEITHGDGYVTRYAHNRENTVQRGERVVRGQVIAALGSSGRTTGPHLHFEVIRDGRVLNPWSFIQRSAAPPLLEAKAP